MGRPSSFAVQYQDTFGPAQLRGEPRPTAVPPPKLKRRRGCGASAEEPTPKARRTGLRAQVINKISDPGEGETVDISSDNPSHTRHCVDSGSWRPGVLDALNGDAVRHHACSVYSPSRTASTAGRRRSSVSATEYGRLSSVGSVGSCPCRVAIMLLPEMAVRRDVRGNVRSARARETKPRRVRRQTLGSYLHTSDSTRCRRRGRPHRPELEVGG